MNFAPMVVNDFPVLAVDVEPVLEFIRGHVTEPEPGAKVLQWLLATIRGFSGKDEAFACFIHDVGTVSDDKGVTIRAYSLMALSGPHMNVKRPTAKQKREAIEQLEMKQAYLEVDAQLNIIDLHEAVEVH